MHTWIKYFLSACLMASFCMVSGCAVHADNLPDFIALVKTRSPAVVNVSTKAKVSVTHMLPEQYQSPEAERLLDEMLKRFFKEEGKGGGGLPRFDQGASGSGFILSADGYIVTNHHVIEDADEILVKLNDRREFKAKLIGSDKRSDVALIKVESNNLPTLTIGDSSKLQVGEWVLAIGSPFGLESSATAGIVSATGRNLPTDSYVPFIQTDVAINPGNSGGPLFNLQGEVIGINSQIFSRSGGYMGLSFSIPINMAMDVVNQLKSKGKVTRGWLGIYIQEVNQDLAKSFGMLTPSGALVAQVIAQGPAVNVLQEGDVILDVNGQTVDSAAALPAIIGGLGAGQKANVTIVRGGKREVVTITIGELPLEETVGSVKPDAKPALPPVPETILGMKLVPLDPAAKKALGERAGVMVEQVTGEAAQQAGLLSGDIILLLDGHAVGSPEQFKAIASDFAKGKTVPLLVQRDGAARFLALTIE